MRILGGLTLVLLLAACSNDPEPITEEQAVQSVKDGVEIANGATDASVEKIMRTSCDLMDDLPPSVLSLAMIPQGYSKDEAIVLLESSAAVYCTEHQEAVEEFAASR